MSGAAPALKIFQRMAQNNAWANRVLLRACARLSEAEYLAERSGFFPSIALTLNHIWEVDRYYLSTLQGIDIRYDSRKEGLHFDSFAELRDAQSQEDRRFIEICNGLEHADLERRVRFVRPGNEIFDEELPAIIAHLAQHQVHHRGQVHAMLSSTSVAPPQLDDFYLDYGADPLALRFRAGEIPEDTA